MNKILSTIACVAVLATTASADFARIEMGAGGFAATPSGALTYTDGGVTGAYTSDEKSVTNAYAWLLVKHPIPILPNLRLEYASVSDEGKASGSFQGFTFDAAGGTGAVDITQYDAVLYYNILDNLFWTTLDLGLDIKYLGTKFEAKGNINIGGAGFSSQTYSANEAIVLPMGYLRVRVQIPVTNIGLETDIKYITYDGSTLSDFRIKADYTFDFVPVVQPSIEIGYRIQKYDLTYNDDKTKLALDFAGVYAGIMLRF